MKLKELEVFIAVVEHDPKSNAYAIHSHNESINSAAERLSKLNAQDMLGVIVTQASRHRVTDATKCAKCKARVKFLAIRAGKTVMGGSR